MAITSSAVCNTFKNQLLSGTHDFDQTSGDIFKVAMYISTATIGKSTTDYLSAGETSGTGYDATGKKLAIGSQTHKVQLQLENLQQII